VNTGLSIIKDLFLVDFREADKKLKKAVKKEIPDFLIVMAVKK